MGVCVSFFRPRRLLCWVVLFLVTWLSFILYSLSSLRRDSPAAVATSLQHGLPPTFSRCFERPFHWSSLLSSQLREIQHGSEPRHFVGIRLHTTSQGFGVQFVSYYSALSVAVKEKAGFFIHANMPSSGKWTFWNYASEECQDALTTRIRELRDDDAPSDFGGGLMCYFCHFGGTWRPSDSITKEEGVSRLYHVLIPPVDGYWDTPNHLKPEAMESSVKTFGFKSKTLLFPEMHEWSEMLLPPDWWEEDVRRVLSEEKGVLVATGRWKDELSREWEGSMACALFCLNERMLQLAKRASQLFGWDDQRKKKVSYIGIHVRRGDRTDLRGLALSTYMEQAELIRVRFGVNRIYIATDDPQILDETQNYPNFKFYHLLSAIGLDGDGEKGSSSDFQGFQWSTETSEIMTQAMLLDMHFLSESDFFIGAQRSLFGWVASRIRIGNLKERTTTTPGGSLEEMSWRCPRWIGGTNNKYGFWAEEQQKEYEKVKEERNIQPCI